MVLSFLVVDDHELILKGIQANLQDLYPDCKIKTADNAEKAIGILGNSEIDVLITDVSMKGMDGIELCKHTKKRYPNIKIVVITQHKKVWIVKQLYHLNVDGLLLKEGATEELQVAIKNIINGQRYFSSSLNNLLLSHLTRNTQVSINNVELTDREKKILALISEEYTTKEIADKLHVGLKTIEAHRKNLLLKFDARNMVGLVKKAMEMGLLD